MTYIVTTLEAAIEDGRAGHNADPKYMGTPSEEACLQYFLNDHSKDGWRLEQVVTHSAGPMLVLLAEETI